MGDLEFCEEPQSGEKGMHCWEVLIHHRHNNRDNSSILVQVYSSKTLIINQNHECIPSAGKARQTTYIHTYIHTYINK